MNTTIILHRKLSENRPAQGLAPNSPTLMNPRNKLKLRSLLLLGAVLSLSPIARANDWPSWRGPEQTGMSREKSVVTNWSIDGDNLLWKAPVGGRTTPIVMNNRLYLITPVGSDECLQERVICLDADSGRTLWEKRFNVFNTDIVENRVGWTAPVGDPETGNVYVHGTGGELLAFDRDGRILWKTSLEEVWGRYSGYGGRLFTPIIDEDRVIVSVVYILAQWGTGPKKSGHRHFAFDKRTGELLWWSQPGGRPYDTTYATPVVAVIDGRRLLIAPDADGNVYAMLARTGEKVWEFQLSKRGLNTTPVVDGNYVYVTHSEENHDTTEMGRIVCIDASRTGDITKSGEVWRRDGLHVGYSSPAVANGRLYVATNSGKLHCLDGKSGKEYWHHNLGTVMRGSPTVTADGVIYVGEVNGRFHILKDAGDKCESLDFKEFSHPSELVVEIFGSPAISDGRVYFMDRYHTYALGEKGRDVEKVSVPPLPKEREPQMPDREGPLKGRLLMIPAETILEPGAQATFRVRHYDENGQFVSNVKLGSTEDPAGPAFFLEGANGSITDEGRFVASGREVFSAGSVTFKYRGLEATSRIRVAPRLNVRESFNDMKIGEPPPGWIGVDGKTAVAEKDGAIVLHKKAESPSAPYGRMHAYSCPPIPAQYTVETDLMGEELEGRTIRLSDMGVINSRYVLMLLGKEQAARVVSWAAEPRLQKDVNFEWKPYVWYRAKLRVDIQGNKGLIRAKVWPRDEDEPQDWTVEVTDPCPNREGSPGLYAYSKGTTTRRHGASVFFDNYRVYAND
jgi:outer membrane protein assembly factor BamB